MGFFPKIVDRSKNYVSLFFRDYPSAEAYRMRAASTLDDAYGPVNGVPGLGTEWMFDVGRGESFRSHSIRQRKLGIIGETVRGQTRVIYDPSDYYNPPTTSRIPPDSDIAFLRVQTRAPGATFPLPAVLTGQGPILILQTPGWWNVPRPALTLSGTAPDIATAGLGVQPPSDSMEFRVPGYGDSLVFTNHDIGNPVYLSMGRGIPMMEVAPGQSFSHTSGEKDSLLIAANGANPTFSVLISTVGGAR
jgi:hypothetical protein